MPGLQNKVVSTMKKENAMKDNKKLEVELKVIKRIYDKSSVMQGVIDPSVIEECAEESISLE